MFVDLTTGVYSFCSLCIAIHKCISRKQACGTGITTGLSAKDMHIHGVVSETTQAFTTNRNVWPKIALL